jgi:hypothetical protein
MKSQNVTHLSHELLRRTLERVADFYDKRKVGDVGPLGFRRSSDLETLFNCLGRLIEEGVIVPGRTRFLDMGCADGRVNIFLSYVVKLSIGIELDEWTLDEYGPLASDLCSRLELEGLLAPPSNIYLFDGDSSGDEVYLKIKKKTGVAFEDFDLFYTYLVMQDEFAGIIARHAKKGALFMVYGLREILPRFKGLDLVEKISPLQGALAVYRKV